ncbi:GNAT family N-acetyltransferase [Staphylococcus sp. 17KM0847]|uniref:GNAT family N-acetyltransferase n=1 Tax=Staphylococcus sp. 17KM0847 TaxID=2583989 RepID=UPI0015DCFA3F|nr:GNAT family N-acetyltransferase [Staphylococcus sp. 17KM0847]QLK85680.1 GNAT family N-acetyltransferase [Staphylococcus sp. 17KM0847]
MIRLAEEKDIHAIAKLTYIIWKDMELEIVERYPVEQVIAAIEQSTTDVHSRNHLSHIYVYEIDGEVAGMIVAYSGANEQVYESAWTALPIAKTLPLSTGTPLPLMEADKEDLYIESVATFPEYRGRGVAHQLMNTLITSKSGATWSLNCDYKNEGALHLYKKLGFKVKKEKILYGHRYHYMTYTCEA